MDENSEVLMNKPLSEQEIIYQIGLFKQKMQKNKDVNFLQELF